MGYRICVDRVLPQDRMRHQHVRLTSKNVLKAIAPKGKTWMNGSTLRVRFMGGTKEQRELAREQAAWWTAEANLTFQFGSASDAEIRVAFDESDGAWSYVGTDARGIASHLPTMNLGFLDGGTAGHEFGHAIGLGHEHQNPAGGIQWNEQVVIAAMKQPPNSWSEEETRHNILRKYSANQSHSTQFDPNSIMLYSFPPEWTLNGIGTEANEVLSELDKSFIAAREMYPPLVKGPIELKVNAKKKTPAAIGKAGEEDVYGFQVSKPGGFVIETSGATKLVMKLFGPDSNTALMATDDHSEIKVSARIAADLRPGKYLVQVRHFSPTKTGTYRIGVCKA